MSGLAHYTFGCVTTMPRFPLQLISGLADEKVRWKETVQDLEYMVNNVAGDVLLSASYVAYLGPFTVSHRFRSCAVPVRHLRSDG